MATTTVETAQLRRMLRLAPRRAHNEILAAYRATGSLEGAARRLRVPTRTLSRIVADDGELRTAVEAIRKSA